MALMKTRDVTIYSVFLVYRKLLEHIKRSNRKLRKKSTPWKKDMYRALLVAKQKLREYYKKTYRNHGFLYGTETLLAPQYKLYAFDNTEYSQCHSETSKRYCEYLRTCFSQYQQQNPETLFCTVQPPSLQASELDRLLGPSEDAPVNERIEHDEVDQYLREATVSLSPRAYWKENKRKFPVLSRLARDLLSIPATGAGVERLFNSARDICHYRRGSLNETTIQDLMMYMCSERFTLKSHQLSYLENPAAEREGQETLEEDEALKKTKDDIAPISDVEENGSIDDSETGLAVKGVSRGESTESEDLSAYNQVQGAAMQIVAEEKDDDRDLPSSPVTRLGDRALKRSSGRITVPLRRLQGYELY